ncbi:MAG: tetratricopeptide repeat protein, partial [Verrucomicrobiae bacterium]|nr:tetratricopeptide repeat protein [Verrucomicrobiae bacterium]
GGSTVQGNPYGQETAFPRFLELALGTVDPSRRWEVINVGGLSYASYRVANLVRECLAYEPDLFVLCTGHNEFLEDRTYGKLKRSPAWMARAVRFASQLRLFNVMRQVAGGLRRDRRPVLREEVDALLDYEGGLKAYHDDPSWRSAVIAHFENNVARMMAMSRDAGVPLILVTPVSNLRDTPPFKCEHSPALAGTDLRHWTNLVQQAETDLSHGRPDSAATALEEATRIDPRHAQAWFRLGQVDLVLSRTNDSVTAFRQARETDVCPLRILGSMESAIARLAQEHDVPWIDWQAMIAGRSQSGTPGNDWLLDHVHPTPKGHMLLAEALLVTMQARGWVTVRGDWLSACRARWEEHVAALPADYFEQGEEALAGLRAWTQGRASGPSIDYRLFNRGKTDGGTGR